MRDWQVSDRSFRLDASAGFASLLFLTGFLVQGQPPTQNEPTSTISDYLVDHRDAILAGDLLIALAAAAFFWFLGAMRAFLADAGEQRLSTAAGFGMGVGSGVVIVGAALQSALVLNSAAGSPEVVRLGFDSYNAIITIAGAAFAPGVAAAATSGARSGILPNWLWVSGIVIGLIQVATLSGLFLDYKPWAAGGVIALLAFVLLVAWFTALTVVMLRGASRHREHAPGI